MTAIQWTDRTWNPVRGCSRVSEGCRNCYAEKIATRFSGPRKPFDGFATSRGWTGRVELVPSKLSEPLRWRKPCRVFVNSMSDLFHEALPDEAIDKVFAVMALAHTMTFQVLTKRPARMLKYMQRRLSYEDFVSLASHFVGPDCDVDGVVDAAWQRYQKVLPNVHLGVSVEDQPTADERIPLLLQTPAAVRFVSYEPALACVDFRRWIGDTRYKCSGCLGIPETGADCPGHDDGALDQIIVGGESGPGARPCDVAWVRNAVEQCQAAGVACFVKQLGSSPVFDGIGGHDPIETLYLKDRKGGDPSEWPEDLRVREFPR